MILQKGGDFSHCFEYNLIVLVLECVRKIVCG
jgi:hypothetical protein